MPGLPAVAPLSGPCPDTRPVPLTHSVSHTHSRSFSVSFSSASASFSLSIILMITLTLILFSHIPPGLGCSHAPQPLSGPLLHPANLSCCVCLVGQAHSSLSSLSLGPVTLPHRHNHIILGPVQPCLSPSSLLSPLTVSRHASLTHPLITRSSLSLSSPNLSPLSLMISSLTPHSLLYH